MGWSPPAPRSGVLNSARLGNPSGLLAAAADSTEANEHIDDTGDTDDDECDTGNVKCCGDVGNVRIERSVKGCVADNSSRADDGVNDHIRDNKQY